MTERAARPGSTRAAPALLALCALACAGAPPAPTAPASAASAQTAPVRIDPVPDESPPRDPMVVGSGTDSRMPRESLVGFATYLHRMHERTHPLFVDGFLRRLEAVSASDRARPSPVSAELEIVVAPRDGTLVSLGAVRSSGIPAFDGGAAGAVRAAAPFGPAPPEIASADGNVYFHWQFHRNPDLGCSTYYCRPYYLSAVTPPLAEPESGPRGMIAGPWPIAAATSNASCSGR